MQIRQLWPFLTVEQTRLFYKNKPVLALYQV
jgi:hypothetical protein